MSMQTIKNGGFVAEELAKINANFTEIVTDYAKSADIPTVPTTTSQLTNNSGFITADAIPSVPTAVSQLTNDSDFVTATALSTGLASKVNAVSGKGLSTEDYTTAEKTKLSGISAPTKAAFTVASWATSGTSKTYTVAHNGKEPVAVMRKSGSDYGAAIVDVKVSGANAVVTADEAFEGYIVLV